MPIPKKQQVINIFRIFANRASAEMQRLRAEKETLEREEKLRRLFHSAMDAIIELDKDLRNGYGSDASTRLVENDEKILSDKELKALERKNILRAVEKTNWRVSGKNGAAALLCIPTSTLNSKIKAFGIKPNPKH